MCVRLSDRVKNVFVHFKTIPIYILNLYENTKIFVYVHFKILSNFVFFLF